MNLSESDATLVIAALTDAADDRDAFADSLTASNGKPLPQYVQEHRKALNMKHRYLRLRTKLVGKLIKD